MPGAPSLTLGGFDLTDGDASAYRTEVMADGMSRGAPVPLDVAVKSWLQDGSIVVTQGYDNRDVTLRVRMLAPDLLAMAQCEAALFAELGKPNLLTWDPGDGVAPPSVFVVITSSMEATPAESEDIGELRMFPFRTYTLRLTCEAFVRSASAVVTPALPAPPPVSTTTDVDTMGTASGWTATVNGVSATVVNNSGPPTRNAVGTAAMTGTAAFVWSKTYSTVTTTSLKYLIVDWGRSPSGSSVTEVGLNAFANGVALSKVAEGASPTAGYTRTWFYVAASSFSVLRFEYSSTLAPSLSLARSLYFDNVAVSDATPIAGTLRQQIRTVSVLGSARTQGSLSIESETAALGDTFVFTYPSTADTASHSPALRGSRTAGNTVTPNAALVSGGSESITGSGTTYQIPVSGLPVARYLIVARLATSGGGTPTISWSTQTVLGGVGIGPILTGSRTITTTTGYQNFVLGRVILPTEDLGDSSPAVQSLTISASATCTLDEAWVFGGFGDLIAVPCGTGAGSVGGSARRLFIEPATVQTERPTVRIGHSADGSDAYHPVAQTAWQFPNFPPPEVKVLTVTSNATDAAVSLRHFPRYHTHAAS